MSFGTKLIVALWEVNRKRDTALMVNTVAACEVLCVAQSPRSMVEQLRYWAELNEKWPAKDRRELVAKLAAWQAANEYQVRYVIPIGERDKLPVVFQFGLPDAAM